MWCYYILRGDLSLEPSIKVLGAGYLQILHCITLLAPGQGSAVRILAPPIKSARRPKLWTNRECIDQSRCRNDGGREMSRKTFILTSPAQRPTWHSSRATCTRSTALMLRLFLKPIALSYYRHICLISASPAITLVGLFDLDAFYE